MKKIKEWFAIDFVRKIQLLIFLDKIKSYLVFPTLFLITYGIYLVNKRYVFISPDSTTIFTDPFLSTLVAALLGGALAFYGSVYVQKSELRSNASIRRRDEIYKPLYNELLQMQSNLIEFPCPSGFKLFENMGYHNDPKFLEWNKFKKDYRVLQVPKIINSTLEELIILFTDYSKNYNKAIADPKVESAIRKIITSNSIKNFSQRRDLTHHYLPCNQNLSKIINMLNSDLSEIENNRQIPVKTNDEIQLIAQTIYIECSKVSSVKELQNIRRVVDSRIQELVKALEKIINYINEKYDQKTKIF